MPLVKSHSNYVLKKRHQDINDGTIYERDITTIGGIGTFPTSQVPVYRSSNFLITINGGNTPSKHVGGTKWISNDEDIVWTESRLSGMTSSDVTQDDTRIVLKQDYYDFKDFAYYGSLSEMFRVSLTHIIDTFPGELYAFVSSPYYYTKEKSTTTDPQKYILGYSECEAPSDNFTMPIIENPFGINIHALRRDDNASKLKYFCDEGYKEYEIIGSDGETKPITSWTTDYAMYSIIKECEADATYGDNREYAEEDGGMKSIISQYFGRAFITEDDYDSLKEKFNAIETKYGGEKCWLQEWNVQDAPIRGRDDVSTIFNNDEEAGEWLHSDKNQRVDDDGHPMYDEDGNPIYYFTTSSLTSSTCVELDCFVHIPCVGDKIAEVTLNGTYKIGAWYGTNLNIYYLPSDKTNLNYHIRPKEEHINEFYNGLSNFERLLMNKKTTPKYTATFSVIDENDWGYTKHFEAFSFPIADGGYNLGIESPQYTDYVTRFATIGEYYDENFTDNLWRSMTHESIKNFDWTHSRDYTDGDDEDYLIGGERIQKVIRIYGREFDEIKSYIDAISNAQRITYDSRGNMPDYVLTDVLSMEGWDVKSPIPFTLSEKDSNGREITNYSEEQQLSNDGFTRYFAQNAKDETLPYKSKNLEYRYGYWIDGYTNGVPNITKFNSPSQSFAVSDTCGVRYRIMDYNSDALSYTNFDVANEFYRRLKLNSRSLWRSKGTVHGIHAILSLFGLKPQKDFDVTEYTSFCEKIEETWDAVHNSYRIDWINSTKLIPYDYRSITNRTIENTPSYLSYQGLPVAARYADKSDGPLYIKRTLDGSFATTDYQDEAYKFTTDSLTKDNYVKRKFLYPYFSNDIAMDGNPYFQMNGGWLGSSVVNKDKKGYNFAYDSDDNIVWSVYRDSGKALDDGRLIDNEYIFKESVRNIKSVKNLTELVEQPYTSVHDNSIVYVSSIEDDIAIIDGKIYGIQFEYVNDKVYRYISLLTQNGIIEVGDVYIYDTITVYDRDGNEVETRLQGKPNGYEVKAYIITDDNKYEKFIAYTQNGGSTITSFCIYSVASADEYTNYFVLDSADFSNLIQPLVKTTDDTNKGWRRLKYTDHEYYKINTIQNYYNGNNPHNGNMSYDNGHEYFMCFKKLFKYALDNDLFDSRCYDDFLFKESREIEKIGFSGLVDDNEDVKVYDKFLHEDTKIHYFGNYYKEPEQGSSKIETMYVYTMDNDKLNNYATRYWWVPNRNKYWLKDKLEDGFIGKSNPYSVHETADDVTNQIVNNKRLSITFKVHTKRNDDDAEWTSKPWYENSQQCEIKYLTDVVIPYMAQMIPSTTIVDIKFYVGGNNLAQCKD